MKDKLNWRRNKVNELSVRGFSQAEILRMLEISEPNISRDIEYSKQVTHDSIRIIWEESSPTNLLNVYLV